jgi:hypothetical protein
MSTSGRGSYEAYRDAHEAHKAARAWEASGEAPRQRLRFLRLGVAAACTSFVWLA